MKLGDHLHKMATMFQVQLAWVSAFVARENWYLVRMLCDLPAYAKGRQDVTRLQGHQVTVLVCVEAPLCYTALELL